MNRLRVIELAMLSLDTLVIPGREELVEELLNEVYQAGVESKVDRTKYRIEVYDDFFKPLVCSNQGQNRIVVIFSAIKVLFSCVSV